MAGLVLENDCYRVTLAELRYLAEQVCDLGLLSCPGVSLGEGNLLGKFLSFNPGRVRIFGRGSGLAEELRLAVWVSLNWVSRILRAKLARWGCLADQLPGRGAWSGRDDPLFGCPDWSGEGLGPEMVLGQNFRVIRWQSKNPWQRPMGNSVPRLSLGTGVALDCKTQVMPW